MKLLATSPAPAVTRLRLSIHGVVQGVGFRPFVFRLAHDLGLAGWVNNSPQGVCLEVEGPRAHLDDFRSRLQAGPPPHSSIHGLEATWLDAAGFERFEIRASNVGGATTTLVLPDLATCPDCRREIFDPSNRRHRYPFSNCTHCGPRFTIIEALPYDRAATSMRSFVMCPACQAEYDDPADRRFHAQPNACPDCGPRLELWPAVSSPAPGEAPRNLAQGHDALLLSAHVLRCGQILAVKGLGGFHLFVDARNDAAVRRLRERKLREEKPFALLFPSLESVRQACEVSELEARLLCSPEAPIVLLRRLGTRNSELGTSVAPGNPNLGVMLPSNPLHHLLLAELGFPVVATSGNRSDEPLCTDEFEALDRLNGVADLFLVHNRPIVRYVDDSIVRVMQGREMVLRRARGFAPLPINLQPSTFNLQPVLAVGAHLKNTVALAVGDQAFVSQHLGDLETEPANTAFRRAAADLPRLYGVRPEVIAADLHPDYLSTRFAAELTGAPSTINYQPSTTPGSPLPAAPSSAPSTINHQLSTAPAPPALVQIQHHVAHVLACLAENDVALPALGVAWDGTGYGTDGTIWGGEFFLVTETTVERVASLRPFPLPGGDAAVKEPRRAALGLLHELARLQDETLSHMRQSLVSQFSPAEWATLETALARGVNAPLCSSVGRLFDAVAALVGLRSRMKFEGQAAMELEFALEGVETDEHYDLALVPVPQPPGLVLDWAPLLAALLQDAARGQSVGLISAKFHNALAEAVVNVARHRGVPRVALSGGCFQNRYLTERTLRRLRDEGFQPYWPQRVPPNDGGIALGQIVAARRESSARTAP
jgi:hydrogenase maturation protein HypF